MTGLRMAGLVGLFAVSWSAGADALPRYAARVGQDCTLCHENPSGGGLRSAYATQFIVPAELAAGGTAPPDAEIAPGVRIGGDLRTLLAEGDDDRSLLVLMQSDLYLAATLGNGTSAYLETTRSGMGAAFGIVRLPGGRGYLRVGRFEPAHGWRFADHRLAVRRHLLAPDGAVDPDRLLDDGVEVGAEAGFLAVQGSVQSGAGGHGESRAGRLVARTSLGPVNLVLGVSAVRDVRAGGAHGAAGVFGAVAGGAWSWLWQVDAGDAPDAQGSTVTHEWTAAVRRGWELRFTYGHHDPDRDLRTGARERWSAGVDAFLTPTLAISARCVRETTEPGDGIGAGDLRRVESVVHVLF